MDEMRCWRLPSQKQNRSGERARGLLLTTPRNKNLRVEGTKRIILFAFCSNLKKWSDRAFLIDRISSKNANHRNGHICPLPNGLGSQKLPLPLALQIVVRNTKSARRKGMSMFSHNSAKRKKQSTNANNKALLDH